MGLKSDNFSRIGYGRFMDSITSDLAVHRILFNFFALSCVSIKAREACLEQRIYALEWAKSMKKKDPDSL